MIAKPAPTRAKPVEVVADTDTVGAVLSEVTPEVPRAVRDKIQGRILVKVRVLVDASGDVMAAMVENRGPNPSLANLADEAAREWKFVPAENQNTRVWILTFAFTRDEVTARATAV